MSSRPGEFRFQEPTQLADQLTRIQQLLRGRLTLHDNVTRNHIVSYLHNAGAGNTETINISNLNLNWTPSLFIVVDIDAATTIFATAADKTGWSATQIVLRSSANNVNVKVMIF